MSNKSIATIATMGIDIGKNSFHVVGLDRRGAIVLRQKWSRGQVETRLAHMPACLIGMEACVGAHHLSRKLQSHGHDARLMPAKYVRPYSKGQKNDFRDAEAIAEAVQRPTMKFLATKTADQLDLQALHRVRERLVSQTSPSRSSPTFREQRSQHGASLVGQLELRRGLVLDQTTDHHVLGGCVRDTGRLPIGVGGAAKEQSALRHRECGRLKSLTGATGFEPATWRDRPL